MVSVVPKGTAGAKEAILDYQVLSKHVMDGRTVSLVEVNLHTGRPHQIRVQFASRKMPLVGDHRYGKGDAPSVALWSYGITLLHPTKKEPMTFCEEAPFLLQNK